MPGTQPTLQSLAEQTAALQRRLLELLATYPEEHLSGHEQYLRRIFSIYWRREEIASNEPYDPSDKRYWDCAVWVRWFEDYIIELEAFPALVELTPQRLALLPLQSKVSEPATRVAELLGTQAEVLQRWATEAENKATEAEAEKGRGTADFWRGLRRDFEELARNGDFKLTWRSSPARVLNTGVPVSDSRCAWPRSMDADQRMRFIATALKGAKALGGESEELWLDTIRLSFEHDRTGVHGNDHTATI